MSELWSMERVLELFGGDRDFIEALYVHAVCQRNSAGFSPEEVEAARIARVLLDELEVNWAGVEIILRLRAQILATHGQVADLFELVRRELRRG